MMDAIKENPDLRWSWDYISRNKFKTNTKNHSMQILQKFTPLKI